MHYRLSLVRLSSVSPRRCGTSSEGRQPAGQDAPVNWHNQIVQRFVGIALPITHFSGPLNEYRRASLAVNPTAFSNDVRGIPAGYWVRHLKLHRSMFTVSSALPVILQMYHFVRVRFCIKSSKIVTSVGALIGSGIQE